MHGGPRRWLRHLGGQLLNALIRGEWWAFALVAALIAGTGAFLYYQHRASLRARPDPEGPDNPWRPPPAEEVARVVRREPAGPEEIATPSRPTGTTGPSPRLDT